MSVKPQSVLHKIQNIVFDGYGIEKVPAERDHFLFVSRFVAS